MQKPNIFDIATKELHQDAFLTWLLSFADITCKELDPIIHECGKELISVLLCKTHKNFNESIVKVEAGRQWKKIDVWVTVNNKYLIIIEDKTISTFHSNQLIRYKEIASKWCAEKNYLPPSCIYLKTGLFSKQRLKAIERDGFKTFTRHDFLKILNRYSNTHNDIFQDYLERLNRLEHSTSQFAKKRIGDWNNADWQGFYVLLDNNIGLVDWKFINNQNGGFWNAVLNWDYWGIYPTYIQIEQGNICFKISTDPADVELPDNLNKSHLREQIHDIIVTYAKEIGLTEIIRPPRFGYGKYMTVAIVKRKDWLGDNESRLNLKRTIHNIEGYKTFLKSVLKESSKNWGNNYM